MRNQIDAAERLGIVARSINSTNHEQWRIWREPFVKAASMLC